MHKALAVCITHSVSILYFQKYKYTVSIKCVCKYVYTFAILRKLQIRHLHKTKQQKKLNFT